MRLLKLFLVVTATWYILIGSVQAQKNKKIDMKLWEYNDASDLDTIHLHTYYKINAYYIGSSYWTNYVNTFELNGIIYFQLFLAFPVYSDTELPNNTGGPCYSREDTLIMFLNEDYSYRKAGCYLYAPVYVWSGLVFEKAVSNALSKEDLEKVKLEFVNDAEYESRDIIRSKKIYYFERIGSGYEYENYIKAVNLTGTNTPLIFIPKYEPFSVK